MILLATSDPAAPIALGNGATFVPLRKLAAPSADRRIYLVLSDLHAAQPPGVVWQLYLAMPKDAPPPDPADPHHVGTLNFFAAVRPGPVGASSPPINRSIDVTDLLRRVAADASNVTLVPDGTPAEAARATIGRIELVAQ
jgi:hypothetical protein